METISRHNLVLMMQVMEIFRVVTMEIICIFSVIESAEITQRIDCSRIQSGELGCYSCSMIQGCGWCFEADSLVISNAHS
jgi:hypothetical protein